MSTHHEELQEIENAKYYWRKGGKWVFASLVVAALSYLGYVVYQGQANSSHDAAAVLASQVQGDAAKLNQLQQSYSQSAVTAQTSLETATAWFRAGKLAEAEQALRWVLANQKKPLFQAMAARNLANILLQQKKYDDALAVLNTPVDESFAPLLNETKGDVYAAQGKSKEATEAYQAALNGLPEDASNREVLQMKMAQL